MKEREGPLHVLHVFDALSLRHFWQVMDHLVYILLNHLDGVEENAVTAGRDLRKVARTLQQELPVREVLLDVGRQGVVYFNYRL